MDSQKSIEAKTRRSNSNISLKSVRKPVSSANLMKPKIKIQSKKSKSSAKAEFLLPSRPKIVSSTVSRYSINPLEFNSFLVETLYCNQQTHLVAELKDSMLFDNVDEFLKRDYSFEESTERMPKIANYYKNYLKFFCKPIFCEFRFNLSLKSYGDVKAKVFYKQNYAQDSQAEVSVHEHSTLLNAKAKDEIDNYKITTTEQSSKFHFDSNKNYSELVTRRSQEESLIKIICQMDGMDTQNITSKLQKRDYKTEGNFSTVDKTKVEVNLKTKKETELLSPQSKVNKFFTKMASDKKKITKLTATKINKSKIKESSPRHEKAEKTKVLAKNKLSESNAGLRSRVTSSIDKLKMTKSNSQGRKISVTRNKTKTKESSMNAYSVSKESTNSPKKGTKGVLGSRGEAKREKEIEKFKFDFEAVRKRKNNSQECVRKEGKEFVVEMHKPLVENLLTNKFKQNTVRNKNHPEIRIKSNENLDKKPELTVKTPLKATKARPLLFKKL